MSQLVQFDSVELDMKPWKERKSEFMQNIICWLDGWLGKWFIYNVLNKDYWFMVYFVILKWWKPLNHQLSVYSKGDVILSVAVFHLVLINYPLKYLWCSPGSFTLAKLIAWIKTIITYELSGKTSLKWMSIFKSPTTSVVVETVCVPSPLPLYRDPTPPQLIMCEAKSRRVSRTRLVPGHFCATSIQSVVSE